ncbi:hypothetical protein QUF55_04780 [Clostridiaceae bacterium HSG29]|nr:hypothetical protein [Clostridiaceae bacterium HSG29]
MSYLFALLGFAIFTVIGLLSIVLYLLSAFGLKKLADNRGIENSWIAFIPVLQVYILGLLIEDLEIFGYEIPELPIVLPVMLAISPIIVKIPVIGSLYPLLTFIIYCFALHKLYKLYIPDNATLYIVLSIVLPFMGPILIFSIRDNELLN